MARQDRIHRNHSNGLLDFPLLRRLLEGKLSAHLSTGPFDPSEGGAGEVPPGDVPDNELPPLSNEEHEKLRTLPEWVRSQAAPAGVNASLKRPNV